MSLNENKLLPQTLHAICQHMTKRHEITKHVESQPSTEFIEYCRSENRHDKQIWGTARLHMGHSPAALLFTWQREVGWSGRPVNLTNGHEYKVTCWVNWCTSLPHSPTYIMMSYIPTETTASFVRHTRHILTACVLERYSFVSLIDVLSLDGSFLVPSSMYSLVTKAHTTPKLQTDTVLYVN